VLDSGGVQPTTTLVKEGGVCAIRTVCVYMLVATVLSQTFVDCRCWNLPGYYVNIVYGVFYDIIVCVL
jgi:hypothetical protein